MKLAGWQSWSPCVDSQHPIDLLSPYLFSPFGQTGWNINIPNNLVVKKPIAGWCSYYAFGTHINENNIYANAKILAEKISPPLETYVVIDEGWCNLGDWNNINLNKFPHGFLKLNQRISHLGLRSGIWLAPFITNTATDYRLRVLPYKHVLDIENSKTFTSIVNTICQIIEKNNFQFIKLDFLYALHHLPQYKNSPSIPDQILTDFLTIIRKKMPHIHINLCGCPLGPAVGNCDSIRLSVDNFIPHLYHLWPINSYLHTHKLSQLQTNLAHRLTTNKLWLLDPDVFCCHSRTGLNKSQILQLRSLIQKANGVYLLGDDLTQLSDDQIDKFIRPLFTSGI